MASAELEFGTSVTFLSINIKILFKTSTPNKEKKLVRKMPCPVTSAGVSTQSVTEKKNDQKMQSSLLQERKCRDVNKPTRAMKRKLRNKNGNAKPKVPEKPPEKDFDAQKLGMACLFLLPNIYQTKSINM